MRKKKPDAAASLRAAFYRKNRLLFALTLGLTLVSVPENLVASWILGRLIDLIAARDAAALPGMLLFTLAFLVATATIDLALSRCKSRFIARAMRNYKSLAFDLLSGKRIDAFAGENTGRYLSVLTNDAASVEENYLNRSFLLIYHGLLFLGALTMMLVLSWQLGLIVLGLGAAPVAASLLLGGGLTAREQAVSHENERFVARLQDLLGGFPVIKSFKAEPQARQLFRERNAQLEDTKRRRRWWEGLIGTVSGAVCGGAIQFGIFLLGAYLAIRGQITAGTVLITVNLCNFILQPIETVPQYLAGRRAASALIGKLAELVTSAQVQPGQRVPPILHEAIELRKTGFSYAPEQPALGGISFRFEAGRSYALVGASGSGKSTLLNLLMGAHRDYTGSVAVDGAELRDIAPESLYDLMSLMGQEVFLFDDSIRNNLTLFRDFPEEAVAAATERAGLDALLRERGMDYRCGENGANLSGGERQRIAIARCLLHGTPVLLLDEATAALDNRTAFAVTDSILQLAGLTRILVTHRLEAALLARFDAIVVLQDGRIREAGTFAELLAARGYFYSLFTLAS